jgi:hypothetical protein
MKAKFNDSVSKILAFLMNLGCFHPVRLQFDSEFLHVAESLKKITMKSDILRP